MISIIVPSRGRPDWLARTISTAQETASEPDLVDVWVYLDHDDPELDNYTAPAVYTVGDRILLSETWNVCARQALQGRTEILMHCGDDVTFNTPGWDTLVREAFEDVPDKILFVYGDDLGPNGQTFGTHGFIHRRWVETVGYMLPPLFSCDWADVWLNDVAEAIGRKRRLEMVTEHHHYTFGKAPRDQTHAEREARGKENGVYELYKKTKLQRKADATKLRAMMNHHPGVASSAGEPTQEAT